MKHIRKAEDKLSETTVFRFIIGLSIKFMDVLKSILKAVLTYITELLMVLSVVGMIVAVQAFDNNAISYTTAILFILILAVLVVTLIKVKILESKK